MGEESLSILKRLGVRVYSRLTLVGVLTESQGRLKAAVLQSQVSTQTADEVGGGTFFALFLLTENRCRHLLPLRCVWVDGFQPHLSAGVPSSSAAAPSSAGAGPATHKAEETPSASAHQAFKHLLDVWEAEASSEFPCS